MAIENLRIYNEAREISRLIVERVVKWDSFHKNTLGMQFVRAVDSIGNNIAEGYARISTAEKLQFVFYADGSLQECKAQLNSAFDRGLITNEFHFEISSRLRRLSISIMEYAAVILERDPSYNGKYRMVVERRRRWLVERKRPPP